MDGTQCCRYLRPPYCLQSAWSWATLAVAILLGGFALALLASALAACARRPPGAEAPAAPVRATATEGQAFECRPQAEEMYQASNVPKRSFKGIAIRMVTICNNRQ